MCSYSKQLPKILWPVVWQFEYKLTNTSGHEQYAHEKYPYRNEYYCKLPDFVKFLDGELCPVHLALLHKIES